MDDIFMSRFFNGNVEGVALLVRTIFGKDDLDVAEVTAQEELKGLKGQGAPRHPCGRRLGQALQHRGVAGRTVRDPELRHASGEQAQARRQNGGHSRELRGFFTESDVLGLCIVSPPVPHRADAPWWRWGRRRQGIRLSRAHHLREGSAETVAPRLEG